MVNDVNLHTRIATFFLNKLNLEAPTIDTDLLQTGFIDSLGLVDLIMFLEKDFGIEVSFDNLEIENFRSIVKIAEFIESHNGVVKVFS
jgi:acyl carrier protein